MFCVKCGSKIPDGSKFCTSCGAKIVTESTAIFTKDDAQAELNRANEDAASVLEAAKADAEKTAKEFAKMTQRYEDTIKEDTADTVDAVAKDISEEINETVEQAENAAEENNLPVPADENLPVTEEGGETAPAVTESEGNTDIVPGTAGDAVPAVAENNTNVVSQDKTQERKQNAQEGRSSNEIKMGKKVPVGLLIVATMGLVVLVIALVFLISGSARNSVKKMFMSDESYFRSVEKNAIQDLADDLSIAYEDDFVELFDFMKSKYTVNIDVDVKDEAEDFLEAIYKKNRDVDLSWIKSAKAEGYFQMKDKNLQITGEANINKKDLFNFDLIGNLTENKYYIGIPILNKEYAQYDLSSTLDLETLSLGDIGGINIQTLIESTAFQDALPSKKELNRILMKYVDIALEKMDRVKIYEDQVLEAGGVKDRYLMISVDLDEEKQPEIIDAILKELSKDDDVLAIVNKIEKTGVFGDQLSADSFLDWIEKQQDEVYNKEYPFRTLNIWVNSSGDVVGQQLVEDNGTGYTYKYVINQGNFGFEAFSTKKNKVLSNVRASGTVSGNSVTGNLKYFTDSGIERLSVDFIDINVIDLLRGNPTGTVLIDIYELTGDRSFKGLKCSVEFDLSLSKSTAKALFSDAGKTIIEADITMKKSSSGTVKMPSKIIEADKNNGLYSWVKNFDWDDILKNADKMNMPSRYSRMLEKWSEMDADSLFSSVKETFTPLKNYIGNLKIGNYSLNNLLDKLFKNGIPGLSESDLYRLIN